MHHFLFDLTSGHMEQKSPLNVLSINFSHGALIMDQYPTPLLFGNLWRGFCGKTKILSHLPPLLVFPYRISMAMQAMAWKEYWHHVNVQKGPLANKSPAVSYPPTEWIPGVEGLWPQWYCKMTSIHYCCHLTARHDSICPPLNCKWIRNAWWRLINQLFISLSLFTHLGTSPSSVFSQMEATVSALPHWHTPFAPVCP